MSTDIKLSKVQIYKVIKSGESFCSWLSNLDKKSTDKDHWNIWVYYLIVLLKQ